jgi:preprotein translocase subunit YajC
MLNKGDKVSVLDEAINGTVVSVKNNEVLIESEDGFMMTFFVNELIKIVDSNDLMKSIKRI